ncbi:MAG: hypothetical protein JO107_03550, partial [Hyphomicrobiales bacterium]|nr:hypothetical protein [Hyphomicrobiales bacterium]
SSDYNEYFEAIVFAIIRSGFKPRCARENDDGGEVRFEKICRIIAECRYGVHDISKTEVDPASKLPRFNMPLELGLFLGARKFGGKTQSKKKALIFDRARHRYQAFISDIAGQDIHSHENSVAELIERISTWLRDEGPNDKTPGGRAIAAEFERFRADLPEIARRKRLQASELTFRDLTKYRRGLDPGGRRGHESVLAFC